MRVLFVISGLGMGGAERQVVLLSRELCRRGHAVGIYTLNRETARADEIEGSAVELIHDQKRIRLDPAVLWRLRRHIQRWRPDVVHGFSSTATCIRDSPRSVPGCRASRPSAATTMRCPACSA